MSMNGEYLRLTTEELARALENPEWAWEFADEAQEREDEEEPAPTEARCFSTFQAWNLLDFLLRRASFPVDVVHGEEPIPNADDWGYGPPQYLTADRVHLAADRLHELTYDALIRGVDHTELATAGVYPRIWDSPTSLEWARDTLASLTEFFRAAASADHAVLVWLD
ncbi:YfbM family protein [Kitasatospora sp. CB01950]|uniref:YfbM family protein n=1 Tax=Kitasatospora sp. CB01950 TaxID=1703930 RepID=UPI00093CFB82|nr:YfbM family protein [Kitasatospora sp. CB01950]OKJ14053.1 hypothetical protein AMK19_10210 [Kitasatospora sp. CB01950]